MKKVHAIFPLHFKDLLFKNFNTRDDYQLTGFDIDIHNYSSYILNQGTTDYAQTVIMNFFDYKQMPFKQSINETVEAAVKIRLARPDIRMVLVFPVIVGEHAEFKENINKLIMAGIYDLHFYGDFTFEDVIDFLDTKQTLQTLSRFITSSDIPILMANPDMHDEKEVANFLKSQNMSGNNNPFINEEVPEPLVNQGYTQTQELSFEKKEPIENIVQFRQDDFTPSVKTGTENKKIAIMGLTKGVGTSFVAVNLASYLAQQKIDVAVYENPVHDEHRTYISDMFMFYEDDIQKPSLATAVKENVAFDTKNRCKIKNVTAYPFNYLNNPILDFSANEMMRYINTGAHNIKILDMGSLSIKEIHNREVFDKLNLFDEIILVIDPMPSKIVPFGKMLASFQNELAQTGVKLTTVINKFSNELSANVFKVYGLEKSLVLPEISNTQIVKAMNKKQTVFDFNSEVQETLMQPFFNLAQKVNLPVTAIEEKKAKKPKLPFFKVATAK